MRLSLSEPKPKAQQNKSEIPFCPHVPTERQAEFLRLTAREALFGGACGGGKSDCLMMAALQYVEVPGYTALIFRRSYADLSLPGALMDRAADWLRPTAARWHEAEKTWRFPSGASLTFGYLEHENSKYRYQGCFHPDTEILADSGWLPVACVESGQRVATLDPETRFMKYLPVTETWEYPFDGELVTLTQRQGSSFAVTPQHQLLASTNRMSRLRKYQATELPYSACIPQWARWQGTEPPELFEFEDRTYGGRLSSRAAFKAADWLCFLGWYLAEGHCWEPRGQISLTQIQPAGRAQIEAVLNRMGVRWHYSGKQYTFYNQAVCNYLKKLGTSRVKRAPREIMDLNPGSLQVFLDALVEGDGTWRTEDHRLGHFVTASSRLADDVAEIAVKAGYRPTLCSRQGNVAGTKFGVRPRWHVSLSRMTHDTMIMGRPGRTPYRGMVYCVTVPPYHTVLTRHRGRVSWSGQSELQFCAFDELSQFSESSYRYLFSRLRRKGGIEVPIRMRAATNPGSEWVKQRFIEPHDDPERAFVPALLVDNPHLDQEQYRQTLMQLDPYTRRQLLEGDWDARPAGEFFQRAWFPVVPAAPSAGRRVRAWDLAATGGGGDATVGLLMSQAGRAYVIEDVVRGRWAPGERDAVIVQTARLDGAGVSIVIEQEPGSAGVSVIADLVTKLAGFRVEGRRSTGDKVTRAGPFASQAQAGNVKLVEGPWTRNLIEELESFPEGEHDDQVDACSLAFLWLVESAPQMGAFRGLVAGMGVRGWNP